MDEETRHAFETINTKFTSLDVEVQSVHTDVKEIKNQLLLNCGKLDKIMNHLGLE